MGSFIFTSISCIQEEKYNFLDYVQWLKKKKNALMLRLNLCNIIIFPQAQQLTKILKKGKGVLVKKTEKKKERKKDI